MLDRVQNNFYKKKYENYQSKDEMLWFLVLNMFSTHSYVTFIIYISITMLWNSYFVRQINQNSIINHVR